MKQCTEDNSKSLHNRLSRIIGQIQAVDRMIDGMKEAGKFVRMK